MNAIVFFIKTNGLYDCFKRNGGSLKSAITYSSHSMDEKLALILAIIRYAMMATHR